MVRRRKLPFFATGSVLIFVFAYYIGINFPLNSCGDDIHRITPSISKDPCPFPDNTSAITTLAYDKPLSTRYKVKSKGKSFISSIETSQIARYKKEIVAKDVYIPDVESLLFQYQQNLTQLSNSCQKVVHMTAEGFRNRGSCVAVVPLDISNSFLTTRTHIKTRTASNVTTLDISAGFFEEYYGVTRGRGRLGRNLQLLLSELPSLVKLIEGKFVQRRLVKHSDITVMVVNQGEMDLYMNFVCSCHAHNISLHNVMVFAGNGEIVSLIEATGAMGVYHAETFAAVSKKASGAFLDKIFVGMMWYKAFSLWVLVHMQYNVLFQDVDVVWYKEPWHYFKEKQASLQSKLVPCVNVQSKLQSAGSKESEYDDDKPVLGWSHNGTSSSSRLRGNSSVSVHRIEMLKAVQLRSVDVFVSDDGGRSSHFAPFHANSGFFYVIAGPKTLHWTWSILTSFDVINSLGSHQKVFNVKLLEAMDLANLTTHVLDSELFPTGKKYHHDKGYMKRLAAKKVSPYCFHMCWTANKNDKIKYMNESHMWRLTDNNSTCTVLSALQQNTAENAAAGQDRSRASRHEDYFRTTKHLRRQLVDNKSLTMTGCCTPTIY